MTKGIIITVVILGLVVLGILAFSLIGQDSNNEERNNPIANYPALGNENNNEPIVKEEGNEVTSMENIIEITSAGFSPSILEIKSGESVTFINKDSTRHWPASDVHPTHKIYPGFDALRGLAQGEEYSFTFTKQGSWGYHDHLAPRLKGTIIVN